MLPYSLTLDAMETVLASSYTRLVRANEALGRERDRDRWSSFLREANETEETIRRLEPTYKEVTGRWFGPIGKALAVQAHAQGAAGAAL